MMERKLKERLIGATILVTFVVLVVPVFLDGPPDGGALVSERILLPGQEGQDTKTVVLNRGRVEPIPAVNRDADASTPGDDSISEPVTDSPVPIPIKEASPARADANSVPEPQNDATTSAASTTGMWAVQLGSFENKQSAEKLAADLRKQGYLAFLSQFKTGSDQLHRVRVGPQEDRESAERMASRLLEVGHQGQVVPHP